MTTQAKPRLATQYLWFVVAFTVVYWLTRVQASWLRPDHVVTLVVGLLIVAVSEAWPIEIGRGHVSLASAGYLSVFIIGGVTQAFWVIVAGTMLSWLLRGFRGLAAVASLALMTLTLQLSALVYHAWAGNPAIGAALFALTFLVVNHLVVNVYYFLRDGYIARADVIPSLAWDALGWGVSLPLVAVYVLLQHAYHKWWTGALGLLAYVTMSMLLSFYYQMRASQTATRRTAHASEEITGAVDKAELVTRVRDAFATVAGFTTFVLYLRDPNTGLIVRQSAVYPRAEIPYPAVFVPDETGLASWALATGVPEFVTDSRQSPSANPSPADDHPIISGFILPLVTDRQAYGIIVLGHDYAQGYSRHDFEMVKVLAHHTAMAYRKWMLQQEAVRLAQVDPLLPEVYNYRYFREVLEWRIQNWAGRPMALAFLDFDSFKDINDRLGHVTGDRVLCLFAEMAQSELRENDIFARYGGDEFVLLFDNVDEQGASQAVSRIQQRLQTQKWLDLDIPLGVSAGLALYPNDAETPEMLLNTADLRMYRDKMERKSERRILPSG